MTIEEAIKKLAGTGDELYCKICMVDSVDNDARTIDCTPIDEGAPLIGVNLQANQESQYGVVAFPEVDSYVVVGFLSKDVAVVLLTEVVARVEMKIGKTTVVINDSGVVFNGGNLGGMVAIEALTSKINQLIDAHNTHTHTVPIGGITVVGSPATQANPTPIVVPPIADKHKRVAVEDYENSKIKQ